MIKIKNKAYWPTQLFTKISLGIAILSGFAVEGADSFQELILPCTLILVFGYIALIGTCRDED